MTETTPQVLPAHSIRSEVNYRDRALDLLRALATIRVFLWHATGAAVLTFVGALPVMFWLNGMLLMRSIQRGGTRKVIVDRARRLLIPYWAFGAFMVTLMAVRSNGEYDVTRSIFGWVLPLVDPVGADWQQGWITEPLWYLRAYAWLLLLSPLLVAAARRSPVRALVSIAGVAVLLEMLLGAAAWEVQDAFTYGFFYVAGIATTLHGEPGQAVRRAGGVVAAVAATILWQVRTPLDGVVNNSHTVHLLVGIATLAAAAEARGVLGRIATRRHISSWVNSMRTRSLTFYLWHAPITGLAWVVTGRIGIENPALVGIVAVTASFLVSFALSGVLAGIENFAGGAAAYQRPRKRQFAIGALGILVLTSGLAIPSTGAAELPPTPSRAPEQADFAVSGAEAFLLAPEVPVQSANATAIGGREDQGTKTRPGATAHPGTKNKTGTTSRPATTQVPATTPRGTTPAVATWSSIAPVLEQEKAAAVDTAIARWLATKPTATVEIALVAPGRFRYNSGYSIDGAPIENAANIPLHSITKTFTAALLLRAVEDGKIRLEDKIGTLDAAPWFTLVENTTLAQLLSHRSGLVTYTDTRAYRADWHSIDGWESTLRATQEEGLAFTPGSKQVYSSTNFIVAGLLAAQIYGLPIEKLIERDLLTPLGLNRTTVGLPAPGAPGTGTGNMQAHITDVARWATAMWRDKTVLGSTGNRLALYVDPVNLLGYGNFAFCPCRKDSKTTVPAAYGGNGAEATMRYYSMVDTVVVLRTPNGYPAGLEELIAEILRIVNN